MVIANLQSCLDRLNADVVLQCHGAKTDRRNTGAMDFNHLHYSLLATTFWNGKMAAGVGRMPCRHSSANRVPPGQRAWHAAQANITKIFWLGLNPHKTLQAQALRIPSYIGIIQG